MKNAAFLLLFGVVVSLLLWVCGLLKISGSFKVARDGKPLPSLTSIAWRRIETGLPPEFEQVLV